MQNSKYFALSEQLYFRMLEGIFYTEIYQTPAYTLAWHHKADDCFSNLAGALRCRIGDETSTISEISEFLSARKRKTTIMITPYSQPAGIYEAARSANLEVIYRDAWMYLAGPVSMLALRSKVQIEKVRDIETMQVFVDTFNASYSGTDPREPYGKAPAAWGETLLSSFGMKSPGRKVEYYLLRENNEPAAILLTSQVSNAGGIYSVGTVPSYRGKGYGSCLTLHAVSELQRQGAEMVFLQTEKDSYNERFYTKLGFKTEWVGEAWSRG